jgi:hypothetical protein
MFGREAKLNYPAKYPVGPNVTFAKEEIVAFGKYSIRGAQARTQFLVRLTDGRELFIKACDQEKSDERYLRKVAKRLPLPYAPHGVPVAEVWTENVKE